MTNELPPLEQAGRIAEAFAEATGEQLATKTDLRDLGASLCADIAAVKADLRAEIAPVCSDPHSN